MAGSPAEPPTDDSHGIARGASIIALGSVTSRVLGFARDGTMAALFGAGAHVDALTLAITLPIQLYELVTGGIVNSALVPVFSEYSAPERRSDLWRLASLVLSVAAVLIALFVALLLAFIPQVVALFALISGQQDPQSMELVGRLLWITLPAVIFLSLSGILTGLLYSLKRFSLPAFTGAVFNLSMVVTALLLARALDVGAMALGLLLGAALQVLLQLPGLGEGLARLRPSLDLRHPGLRRILRLYVPIILGLIITQASIYIGLGLAWEFTGGLGWMRYATTLYQFPLGLVATAVASATLPALARQAQAGGGDFKATLVHGLNLVLLLMVPATLGLFVLARPIVALAFERGQFTVTDTLMTAHVLQVFLLGLSFAAVDQLLIFAFYARQDTLTPSLVGVFSVGVYLAVALATRGQLGLFSLMLADSLKQVAHALATGVLLARREGSFRGTGLWPALARILLAAALMAGLVFLGLTGLQALRLPDGLASRLLLVAAPGALGVAAYFALAVLLRVTEARLALALLRRRLGV